MPPTIGVEQIKGVSLWVLRAGTQNCYAVRAAPCVRCELADPPSNKCRQRHRDLRYCGAPDSVGWQLERRRVVDGMAKPDGMFPNVHLTTSFDADAFVLLHAIMGVWSATTTVTATATHSPDGSMSASFPVEHANTRAAIARTVVEYVCGHEVAARA